MTKIYKYIVEECPSPPIIFPFTHKDLGIFDSKEEMFKAFPRFINDRNEEFYLEDDKIISWAAVWWGNE